MNLAYRKQSVDSRCNRRNRKSLMIASVAIVATASPHHQDRFILAGVSV